MQVSIRNMEGSEVGSIDLSDAIFAAEVNTTVMHQALVRQLANRRQGTHKTKTRSEVRGGGAKPWRQKGTGRARQGTIRAPQWRGGGTVFGPQPRSYRKRMPRKMRRVALRSALSVKASEKQIIVLDELALDAPRTRDMVAVLDALDVDRSALVLLPESNSNIELSARNLPNVKTLRAGYINVRDLLGYETIVVPQQTLSLLETFLGDEQAQSDVDEQPVVEEA
ncbi:MAG: 50S ribosomal protein L4 [Chloroflexi bacterium]|nr:50S ribosomal protein L4 [Chloroflexota bacterium]